MATVAAGTFMNSRRSIPARLLFLLIYSSSTIILLSDSLFSRFLLPSHFYSYLFLHDILKSPATYGMVSDQLTIVQHARNGKGPRCVLGLPVTSILYYPWFYSVSVFRNLSNIVNHF